MPRAPFYGGGPADGETRDVCCDELDATIVETLPPQHGDLYPRERAHVYRRQPDGRYAYVGAVDAPEDTQRPPDAC